MHATRSDLHPISRENQNWLTMYMQLDWALGWRDQLQHPAHTSFAQSYPQIVLLRKHMVTTHNASYDKQITSIIGETHFPFQFRAMEKLPCHCSRPDSRCLCQSRGGAANPNTFSLRERQGELMIVLKPAPITRFEILVLPIDSGKSLCQCVKGSWCFV